MKGVQSAIACNVPVKRLRLDVTGVVQGVGFRPFVYRLASAENLHGSVCNTSDGVSIEIEGEPSALERFLKRLDCEIPPHASVHERRTSWLAPQAQQGFIIGQSTNAGTGAAAVLPDLATCPNCLREVLDPEDRRHLYPFTTCVQCGPRYSIIEAPPYDRERTTMRRFQMCPACQAEYTDPICRRFHAEAVACPECGPQLALWDKTGRTVAIRHSALQETGAALHRGMIVALKGLGGFQLLVDARNDDAVRRLRARKRRPHKPFALMFPSLEAADKSAHVRELERYLLTSPEAPIVLLRGRSGQTAHAPSVAPDNPCLGVMLPYTPLHHLLLRQLASPVVATSGNRGDEPIIADENEALKQLAGIADYFLVHDRQIRRPIDDSVVRVIAGQEVVLRHARGYAPAPFKQRKVTAPILALGGHKKVAIATGCAGRLILGAHVGDLATATARVTFARMAADLPKLHGIAPHIVACDRHPDYHSTQVASCFGHQVQHVPHHVAHVLSCMLDNELEGPVLGVAWDGTGYGDDGTVWGGEFLTIDTGRYCRVAHLRCFRLPGGEVAVREPRRAALGLLYDLYGERALAITALTPVAAFTSNERAVLATMLNRGINSPLTSSAGRLFDAAAALLGFCQVGSFEGQAAMAVEFAADRATSTASLPPVVVDDNAGRFVIDWRPLLAALVRECITGAAPEPLAAALQNGLVEGIVEVAKIIGARRVVLTGGCFQNARLTERTVHRLHLAGFDPYWHHRIPPNDGGLAIGQIAFAAHPLIEERPDVSRGTRTSLEHRG
jgi:hydrogenase maturation protein HypF